MALAQLLQPWADESEENSLAPEEIQGCRAVLGLPGAVQPREVRRVHRTLGCRREGLRMNALERLRLEKAAADCGFEMSPVQHSALLELRSARFPEAVMVQVLGEDNFEVCASDPAILKVGEGTACLRVDGYSELYALLRATAAYARTKPNRVADEFRKKTSAMPKTTEAERLVVQRVGQDLFRSALLDYWQGRCCVTGLDVPELLRASHIRPWAKCETDEQRLDVFNGLLLAPHLDALFDGGWITFSDAGECSVSTALGPLRCEQLGLVAPIAIQGLRPEHRVYLKFHRSTLWRH